MDNSKFIFFADLFSHMFGKHREQESSRVAKGCQVQFKSKRKGKFESPRAMLDPFAKRCIGLREDAVDLGWADC